MQKEFSKVLQAEHLEPCDRYWMSGLLRPGTARSNTGVESQFKHSKKEARPEVRQVRDFLLSTENRMRATSLTINEDCVKRAACHGVGAKANERDFHKRAS